MLRFPSLSDVVFRDLPGRSTNGYQHEPVYGGLVGANERPDLWTNRSGQDISERVVGADCAARSCATHRPTHPRLGSPRPSEDCRRPARSVDRRPAGPAGQRPARLEGAQPLSMGGEHPRLARRDPPGNRPRTPDLAGPARQHRKTPTRGGERSERSERPRAARAGGSRSARRCTAPTLKTPPLDMSLKAT